MFIWGTLWLCEFEDSQKLRILSLLLWETVRTGEREDIGYYGPVCGITTPEPALLLDRGTTLGHRDSWFHSFSLGSLEQERKSGGGTQEAVGQVLLVCISS